MCKIYEVKCKGSYLWSGESWNYFFKANSELEAWELFKEHIEKHTPPRDDVPDAYNLYFKWWKTSLVLDRSTEDDLTFAEVEKEGGVIGVFIKQVKPINI